MPNIGEERRQQQLLHFQTCYPADSIIVVIGIAVLLEAVYTLLLASALYPKVVLGIVIDILRMLTVTMSLLVRLGALCGVTVSLALVASLRGAVTWIGSRTRTPSRPSSAYRYAAATTTTTTTTFVGSAWNNYSGTSSWCCSCTPTGKRQRNDMYLPEPSLSSSNLSHVRYRVKSDGRCKKDGSKCVCISRCAKLTRSLGALQLVPYITSVTGGAVAAPLVIHKYALVLGR